MLLPYHDDNPTVRKPVVTIALIVVNSIALFMMSNLPGNAERAEITATYGFVPARVEQLWNPQKVVKVPIGEDRPFWLRHKGQLQQVNRVQVIQLKADKRAILLTMGTSLFLHGGIMHLLGNMWFLWIFGNNIEDRLGHVTYLLFYLIGGALASLCHWIMISDASAQIPVIGASGAIAVMLGAYLVTYPTASIRCLVVLVVFFTTIELSATIVLSIWLAMQVIEGVSGIGVGTTGGVAWWAHIGGFLIGMIVMPVLAAGTPDPGVDWEDEANRQFLHLDPNQDKQPANRDDWWEHRQ